MRANKKPIELIEDKLKSYKPHKFENKKWISKEKRWEYFEDISFGKVAIEIKRNLDMYIDYENCVSITGSGVYLIEDFYIGQTNNIINRVTSHILECFYEEYGCKTYFNKEKCKLIKKVLSERKLKVKMIDADNSKEREYIDKLKNDFNLVNVIGIKTTAK